MKNRFFYVLIIAIMAIHTGCKKQNDPSALTIQKPYTYDEQYFTNLRAYKASPHQVFYGWFAGYSNKEGVEADYKQSASWGEHFAGLPDSLDFCSLWGGIPSLKKNDSVTTYNPIAYTEMRKSMEVRGIKMLAVEITRIQKPQFKGRYPLNDLGIQQYAQWLINQVKDNDLDGLDLDYEPEGDWLQNENFNKFITILGKEFGPKSSNPKKYLVIDYYSQPPLKDVEPYINLLVNQAYGAGSANALQSIYNRVTWCPTNKFIVTETFGDYWATGGVPFTEADGNTLSPDGKRMMSLEGMARWNPTQGPKAGWGAFYFERDYNNGPFPYVRRSIQAANPAVK
ncbi:glycoside hydrolase family 18 [Mucilaginibacter sp. MD40]|uniref:glycoside hydrolase family 18 n=1 Tax=Mucilaginibacter sp. MD40 TaxID=2029590 RepID=UPI00130426C9|nr:glycoside hydrolase family 18 [Mucilaginibacter sp. MD40]